jgi:hypothetical protein
MRKILFASLTILLFATLILSFIKPEHKTNLRTTDCSPVVTVHAFGPGILLTLVTINGHNYPVNLSSNQSQDFTDPSWTQGKTMTITIACAGGGSHTRMRSINVSNPYQCITYPNYVTNATITSVKQCATLQVTASTFPCD